MLYNTAFFWKISPLELWHSPISKVIEMANEGCRIAEEIREREKRNGR
nr:MAG TPA: hypothetical protein [Caudoviricetes sp.]